VRRVIDTTNALESVHAQLRKIINTYGHCIDALSNGA
jgi:transposase-like protein